MNINPAKQLPVIFLLLSATACGAGPAPKQGVEAPPWFKAGQCSASTATTGQTFCAEGTGSDQTKALKAAIASALGFAAGLISTRTQSKVAINTQCFEVSAEGQASGGCSENTSTAIEAQSASLAFRNIQTLNSKTAGTGDIANAWVQLSIPDSEWKRVRRKALNKNYLWVSCRIEDQAGCPDDLIETLTTALPKCGLKPAGELLNDNTIELQAVQEKAIAAEASQIIRVNLRSAIEREQDDIFEAISGGSWTVIDTADGRNLGGKKLPSGRKVAMQRKLAIMGAFNGLNEKLTTPSCGSSVGQGSICCALQKNQ